MFPPTGWRVAAVAAAICVSSAAVTFAQFGRGGRFGFGAGRIATAQDFDGRFHYCRVVYRQPLDGAGRSWPTYYPLANINSSSLSPELTGANVSSEGGREPRH